jgi:iron-sulfur cluster repair protein YtfE (RIC family)
MIEKELLLTARKNLPEHLRVLADKYPATSWQTHPNFSDLASFWLERHSMFREVIKRIKELSLSKIDNRETERFEADLSRYSGFFLQQLHGHHTIEDQHFFPQLSKLDTRLDRAFEILDSDHEELHFYINQFGEKTNLVLMKGQDKDQARDNINHLFETHVNFEKFLHRHLTDEEEIIVPLILEYDPDLQH